MTNLRLIARLDVKAPNLIKGVHLEGLRKLGDPQEFAERYYKDGIDEIIYIDSVASLYERNTIIELVRHTAQNVFIPITAGGGIRSVEDASLLLRSGADKVAVNTAAIQNPKLINQIAEQFGSQCMVLSVQAKSQHDFWEVYCDQGREPTGLNVIDWIMEAQVLGAGEILLTSVDRDGTEEGFDLKLLQAVSEVSKVPLIASGGMGCFEHLLEAVHNSDIHAVAMAKILHYNNCSVGHIREQALANGLPVRSL